MLADHGTGLRATGRPENREAAAAFFKAFSDLHIEQTSHLTVGSEFAAEWTMRGLHTGDLPGMPATGRSFSVAGAKFTRVRNGEIVSATLYWNMADLLTQVGVLRPRNPSSHLTRCPRLVTCQRPRTLAWGDRHFPTISSLTDARAWGPKPTSGSH